MTPRGISVIGNVNVDVIVRPASRLPPPGTEWTVEHIEIRTGGAAAIAAMTLARLGEHPRLVGCLGDDASASIIREDLARAGVEDLVGTLAEAPTGASVAFEGTGRDRSFLTALGSLTSFEASMVPPAALDGALVLVCGYFLLPALRGDPTLRLLGDVRRRGGTTLFDCGWDPSGWPPETKRELLSLLPLVDIFLPNETEATALLGVDDPAAAARALQEVSGSWVVVKLGVSGCLAVGPGRAEAKASAPAVEPIDTTGAGDAFNAGLMYALRQGMSWSEALPFATKVASTVVVRPSRNRYPTIGELPGMSSP
jgi:sugar/nucleoside kinase (ribokinase family)